MENKKPFYGWRVAIGCFLIVGTSPGAFLTLALYMNTLSTEFAAPMTMVALVMSASTATCVVLNMFFMGSLVTKIGPKSCFIIGGIIGFLGFVVWFIAPNIYVMILGGALNGFSLGLCMQVPSTVLINSWFIKSNKRIMTVMLSSMTAMPLLFTLLAGQLLTRFPWRTSLLLTGAIALIVVVLSALLLIKNDPQKYGQKPYGYDESIQNLPNASETEAVNLPGYTNKQAMKTACYWLFIVGGVLATVMANRFAHFGAASFQSMGADVVVSSYYIAVFNFISLIVTAFAGFFYEKVGSRLFVILGLGLGAVGLFAVSIYTPAMSTALVIVFIFLVACGASCLFVLPPLLVPDLFGKKHYQNIVGPFIATAPLASVIAEPIVGAMIDSGGFSFMWRILVVIGIISIVLLVAAVQTSPLRKMQKAKN